MVTREEKLRLANFLEEARDALAEIVGRLDQLAPSPAVVRDAGPSEDQLSLQRAWAAYLGTDDLQSTLDRLRGTSDEAQLAALDRLLTEHGLYGPQLDFKLRLFAQHLQRFQATLADLDAPAGRRPSAWQRVRALLGLARPTSGSRPEEVR